MAVLLDGRTVNTPRVGEVWSSKPGVAKSNPALYQTVLFCSIFILLLRESDGDAVCWTNPHPLRSCPFPSFLVVSLTSYH